MTEKAKLIKLVAEHKRLREQLEHFTVVVLQRLEDENERLRKQIAELCQQKAEAEVENAFSTWWRTKYSLNR